MKKQLGFSYSGVAGPMIKPLAVKPKAEAPAVEVQVEVAGSGGFDVARFVESFEVLAEAPGGIERLRALTLHLAIQGRLTEHEHGCGAGGAAQPDQAVPYPAPPGWMWRRVDQVGELKLGRQRSPQNHTGPHMRPYLRVANVFEARIDTSDVLQMNFTPDEAERFLLKPNDILLNEGQSYELVGRPAIYQGEVPGACFQNTLIRFRPSDDVLPAYALIVFRAYMRTGRFRREAQQTTNIAHLSAGRLAGVEFPLPPLAEQKRIVARVDELMRMLDDLEAKQAKKREVQGRLRAAALDALTSAEGPEEVEAAWLRVMGSWEVLFERAESVEELRACVLRLALTGALLGDLQTRMWRRESLGTVADCRLGKMLDKAKNRGTARPYLRNTNVHWFSIRLDDVKTMLFEDDEVQEYELRPGDVMVCEGGHGIGRAAVWRGEDSSMTFQKALHRLRPKGLMESDFLAFQIKVAADTGRLAALFTGAGISHLTGRSFASLELVVPPLAEQRRIVAKVEHMMKLCDELEARLKAKEETAAKLVEAVVRDLVA